MLKEQNHKSHSYRDRFRRLRIKMRSRMRS